MNNEIDNVSAHTITVRRLEVVDSDGVPRAKLYTAEDGTPVFALYDQDLRPRLTATLADNDEPGVVLYGARQIPLIEIRVESDIPEARLYDLNGSIRARIYVNDSRPALNWFDDHERLRLSFFLAADGPPSITFHDSAEKVTKRMDGPE